MVTITMVICILYDELAKLGRPYELESMETLLKKELQYVMLCRPNGKQDLQWGEEP